MHRSIYVELCSCGFLNEDTKELVYVLALSTIVPFHLRLSAMPWLSPCRDCTSEYHFGMADDRKAVLLTAHGQLSNSLEYVIL